MIEIGVITLLAADEDIANRTQRREQKGLRIYLGRIPQGVATEGGTIVVTRIGRSREYGVSYEEPSQFTTLQIDCYDSTPQNADSLAELVAGVVSGDAAIGIPAGDHHIESSLIIGERVEYQKPQGATDDWRPRDSRDYRIHHT